MRIFYIIMHAFPNMFPLIYSLVQKVRTTTGASVAPLGKRAAVRRESLLPFRDRRLAYNLN